MKKILSLLVIAGLFAMAGCADETKSSKKTETSKEVKKPGGTIEKTTVKQAETKEDGKVIEKKEEKKVEQK